MRVLKFVVWVNIAGAIFGSIISVILLNFISLIISIFAFIVSLAMLFFFIDIEFLKERTQLLEKKIKNLELTREKELTVNDMNTKKED